MAGSSPRNRTLLLIHEAGLGDTLQFIRYAHMLQQQGARILVYGMPQSLHRLLSASGYITQLVELDEPLPPFDAYAPLMSLPFLTRMRVDTIPSQVPYLSAPAVSDLPTSVQRLLQEKTGCLKIGIVWASGPAGFAKRYCPLSYFEPLFELQSIQWFSLYKGEKIQELNAYQHCVVDIGSLCRDFADTAWCIQHLDLLICVDTSVAHLAGALAKPVWILLPFVPDWRWFQEREDTPWYPTARLFRQPKLEDWATVMEKVRTELLSTIAMRLKRKEEI
jgi:hypothetical protein